MGKLHWKEAMHTNDGYSGRSENLYDREKERPITSISQQFPGLILSRSIGIYLKIRMRFGINLEQENEINPQ